MADLSMPQLLTQADYILDSCGRPTPPDGISWVDIPGHVGYSRSLPGDGTAPGTTDITGLVHHGRVPFFVRGVTATALPAATQGVYWRLKFPNGRFFQSSYTPHASAFGIGSDRQLFMPEVEWRPGEKMFVDLDTTIAGPPPTNGYQVSMMFEGVYRFQVRSNGRIPPNPLGLNLPRYYRGANQNIMCPEFRYGPGCPSETPDGYQDEEFTYVSPVANLPITGAPLTNIGTQIEPDSDFYIRQIWGYFPANQPNQGTSGTVSIRLTRGDGYQVSQNYLPLLDVQGVMFKELKVKARDNLYFDALVVDGTGAVGSVFTFGMYFVGVKRRRVS